MCVAPNFLANSNFSSEISTAIIGKASSMLAIINEDKPAPPTLRNTKNMNYWSYFAYLDSKS